MIVDVNLSDIHAYCIVSSSSKIRLGRLNVQPFSIQQLSCILYGLVKYYDVLELNQEKVSDMHLLQSTWFLWSGRTGLKQISEPLS